MSKLIVIRGNSGSGKTTTAKRVRLLAKTDTALIEQDHFRRIVLKQKDLPNAENIELIQMVATFAQSKGYNVILEGILSKNRYEDMIAELIEIFDETYVYYFDIPFKETLRRHSLKPNMNEFGEKEMKTWYKARDYLMTKNETVFSMSQSQDEIVAQILKDTNL